MSTNSCTKVWNFLLSPYTSLCRCSRNFSAFWYGLDSLVHSAFCCSLMSPLLSAAGRREDVSMLFTKYSNASFRASASAEDDPALIVAIIHKLKGADLGKFERGGGWLY